jgi:glucose-6-phosphate 1-epimerase
MQDAPGGFEYVSLSNGRTNAKICTYGAHVVEATVEGERLLFLSQQAVFEKGKAIRGGIPVIWPQFSNRGPLPSHGFARVRQWTVHSKTDTKLVLELQGLYRVVSV